MKYEYAPDIQQKMKDFSRVLFPHVKIERVKCFRSYGSSARGVYARCHTIGKLMQQAMGVKAFYTLEFLYPRFEKLSNEEQEKTIIHELMHIPKTFGGGFRQHDFVCDKNINQFYKILKAREKNSENISKLPKWLSGNN